VKGFYGPNHPCPTCAGSGRAPAKRYLHVAPKYHPPPWAADYYDRAFAEACRVATALGVPAAYRPHEAYCALRVLEYPPGAGTVEHTDSDLFTIVLWRSTPEDLEIPRKTVPVPTQGHVERYCAAIAMSPGMHIGKIGELVGLGPATPHRVPARPYAQKSIVFFAIPDHAAVIHKPWGPVADEVTVGEWLDRELAKMRYEAT
jgi:isopenicillin N synthase-like dioxygenase